MSVWWIAKTNLCPPLRDFCERCTKCSINAVYFSFVYSHFSFKDHCLSYSTTATECLLSQRGVHIQVDFSFSFVPNFVVNQVKAAFHTLVRRSCTGNQEYGTSKKNQSTILCLSYILCNCHQNGCVYICDYLWIQYIMYSMIFILASLKCTFALSRY